MAQPDIRILVGNTGDASPSGQSANKIRDNLQQAFSRRPAYLQMGISKGSLDNIRKRLLSSLQDIEIDVVANVKTQGSGSSKTDNGVESYRASEDALVSTRKMSQATKVLTRAREENIKALGAEKLRHEREINTLKESEKAHKANSAAIAEETKNLTLQKQLAALNPAAKLKEALDISNNIPQDDNLSFSQQRNQILSDLHARLDGLIQAQQRMTAEDANWVKQKIAQLKQVETAYHKYSATTEKEASKLPKVISSAKLELQNFNQYLQTLKPVALSEFADQIENIRTGFSSGTFEGIEDARRKLKDFKADMKLMGYEGGNIVTYLHEKFKSFFTYLISSGALMNLIGNLTKIYDNVVSLDGALTDLRIVTGATVTETKALLDMYNQMAKQLGSTTAAVAESAVEWQRQGYNISDTNTLIKNSMLLSIVGMVESADAAQYLTSAIKGYQVEAANSIDIVDKLTAVDMQAAVSAGGLAEAMARTANSARQAGVDMNSLIGYLATVGEVTQRDMSTVGEAFKTIFARYGNVKLGNLVDPESGESLNDFETALNAVGISLRDQSGQFRDFNDVMKELGDRYKSLSDVEKSAIATTLGGVRQRENVLVLMENLEQAFAYAETAATSAGTALEKFGVYEESIEYRSKRMTAAFEDLSLALLDGDLVKWVMDMTTGLFEFGASIPPVLRDLIALSLLLPTLNAAFQALAASSIGTAFKTTFAGLAWPETTGDIVAIYGENAA